MNLKFGQFRLELAERVMLGPDGPIELPVRSFDILTLLLENAGQIVGKNKLLNSVWPGQLVGENTLHVHVSALRRALPAGLIKTVHGRGYLYSGPKPIAESIPTEARASVTALPDKPSIAVLPFTNMSDDPEQQYFSDGITEDIITELSRFRSIFVIARNSSFQFREKSAGIEEIGRKLGVQFVVDGSVRKLGNSVRVTVRLMDALSTAHIWAERYDRALTDIFAIQDDITGVITAQLAIQTNSVIANRSRTRPIANLSAYEYFLQAMQLSAKYSTMLEAEPLLLKAIELDHNIAAAYAMMSMLETVKYHRDNNIAHLEEAIAWGSKAMDISPEEPMAHCWVGFALYNQRRFSEAGHYLDRAASLNPNDAVVRAVRALWMHYTGQTEEALREIEEALRRDPYATDWFWDNCGQIQTVAGRYQEAIASFRRMRSVARWGHYFLAICHAELGQTAEVKESLERLVKVSDGRSVEEELLTEPFENPETIERLLVAFRHAESLAAR